MFIADGGGFEEEAGQQTFVPFLLCIGLGSDSILPSCLHSTTAFGVGGGGGMNSSNTGLPYDVQSPSVDGDITQQSPHPPGAPHLPSRPSFGG